MGRSVSLDLSVLAARSLVGRMFELREECGVRLVQAHFLSALDLNHASIVDDNLKNTEAKGTDLLAHYAQPERAGFVGS